jgi:hypothetical protein
MSATGTGSRTGETKSAGAMKSGAGAMKSGEVATEAQAAKALGVSRKRLGRAVRTGLIFSFWCRGQRYVVIP